jgi:hypothetical protein
MDFDDFFIPQFFLLHFRSSPQTPAVHLRTLRVTQCTVAHRFKIADIKYRPACKRKVVPVLNELSTSP